MSDHKTGPLSGLRVVELSSDVSAAWCARQFADWGADVVIAEDSQGSPLRRARPYAPGTDTSLLWEYAAAGKRSFTVNTPGELSALTADADVVVTDRSPDEIDVPDSVVLVSITPFGLSGPYAGLAGSDLVTQALSGYLTLNGERDGPPLRAPASILGFGCGVAAFVGALAAIRERDRSGHGQTVEVSRLEAIASIVPFTRTEYIGRPERRSGGAWSGIRLFAAKDGHMSLYPMTMLDQIANALLVCGVDVPAERPARTDPAGVIGFIADGVAQVTCREFVDALWSVDEHMTIYDRVYTPGELPAHEQLAARAWFLDVDHPKFGRVPFAGPAAKLSGTPMQPPAPAPELGQPSPAAPWGRDAQTPECTPDARSAERTPDARPPLAGVRIADLTQAWLGPYASELLAVLGAEVIKIESPKRPDVWRMVGYDPRQSDPVNPMANRWNMSPLANSVNCNKRSLTLDLSTDEGRRLLLELVESCDILMENFTSGALERLGLSEDLLRQAKPDLVIASFSGYGRTGPYAGYRANGITVETTGGWVALHGYPDGPPIQMGFYQADALVGLQLAGLTLSALRHRDRTGEGQTIDGSMHETVVQYVGDQVLFAHLGGDPRPAGNRHPDMAPHGVFRCTGDDEWVAITVRHDADWAALVKVAPELDDPRFATTAGRLDHVDEVEQKIEAWTAGHSRREVMDSLQAVGVPAGSVQRTSEVLDDPHLAAREWFATLEHADMGTHRYAGFPWRLSRSSLVPRTPPPRLGEHSRDILAEKLGLTQHDIDRLERDGVTGAVLERPAESRGAEVRGAEVRGAEARGEQSQTHGQRSRS